MRVTSASAKVSCFPARAASRTLYDFARSEPGMTRILGTAMTDERWTHDGCRGRIPTTPYARLRRLSPSVPSVDPNPRRRNVHPHPLGRLRAHALEALRDRRNGIVGELNEGGAR